MEQRSFGAVLAALRKERGMTQLELAEKMGVTDKAVSKWERDLSYPDVSSIPKLAELFQVSVDELMQGKREEKNSAGKQKGKELAYQGRPVYAGPGPGLPGGLPVRGPGVTPAKREKALAAAGAFLLSWEASPPGPFLEEGAALTPGS